MENPERPLTIVLGGLKVSDKLPLLMNLIRLADNIIIGGAMSFSFLKQQSGMEVGDSVFEEKMLPKVKQIIDQAQAKCVKLHLPEDFICAKDISGTGEIKTRTERTGIEPGWKGFDIGPISSKKFREVISKSKTVIMNGSMGVFEREVFA